jgi:uncharacterized Tic20 family protein
MMGDEVVTFEDRLLAAMSHLSVLLFFFGMTASIVIWAVYKDKSKYVRFQALQAAAFQLSLIILWFAGMVVYMGSFFVMIAGEILSNQPSPANQGMPVLFLLPFAVMMCLMASTVFAVIYGLFAAYSTYRGRDFKYVFLGAQVQKRLDKNI